MAGRGVDTSLVGVDIGTSAVRAVRLAGVDADGFALIERFGVAPLADGVVRAGKIVNVAAAAAAVRAAVAAAGAQRRPVVLGAMATEAAVAQASVPAAVPAADRLKVLRTLGVQVTPTIAPTEAALATSFVRSSTTADGRQATTLSVAATPANEIETLLAVGDAAGVSVEAIDLAAAATLRALVRDEPSSVDVACVVDLGASSVTVVTRVGPQLWSVRALPAGGDDLTRALVTVTHEEWAAGQARKHAMRLAASSPPVLAAAYGDLDPDEVDAEPATPTSAEEAISLAADMLVDTVAQAVETDTAAVGRAPSHVALCGGTALTKGLTARLQRRLGVECRIGHPWAYLVPNRFNAPAFLAASANAELVPGREDPRLMLSLATACGLALRPRTEDAS